MARKGCDYTYSSSSFSGFSPTRPLSRSVGRVGKNHGNEVAYSYPLLGDQLGNYNVLYSDEILGGTFSSATAEPITPVRLLQLIREAPVNACSV